MTSPSPRSRLREAAAAVKREAIYALLRALPSETSVQLQFFRAYRRFIDMENPQRFTEKIQILKLRGGLEAHSGWVDKLEAKRRVAEILGEQWITPTLWRGRQLPPVAARTWPTPYLIKANHGSGFYHHVVTEADKDWPRIEKECASWLRQRWHPHLRERQYDAIVPELLVEPRLGGTAEVLPYDYKFGVYNGRAEYCGVSVGRLQGITFAVFDRQWRPLPFTLDKTPPATFTPEKPPHFEAMLEAAEVLARPFHYARIDFYDLPDGPRFGEITLTPGSGHLPVQPDEWDFRLGAMLDLSSLREPRARRRARTESADAHGGA
jgi:hypothetical protein